ncbi:Uncharacterized protein ALO43_01376 [Pseudomonas tremae]|uniref:TPM domain-containing protein n=4 Tax=Pseudomonas TaxID=286 RepID=A0AA40P989_9PSED|nr:Uncharacterized protein ALO43_01376 [Pseudomonas tremae]KPZ20583.1 Uncharacterized protein ALO38_00901 [Pseudomonas coronafaciens pv. zizaniae]QIQ73455.1 hypothetical protein HBB04_03860 [Pseudomonas coronafaciens]RMM85893.1 hypothetical protein ALQ71_01370 [Pseudomonas coronafaciens pv. striafaciens]RMT04223.1 hypothetical protein ALP55_00299 [Pseudomonas coronafaciens pv. oryzae]
MDSKSTGGLILKSVSRWMLYVVMLVGGAGIAGADEPALVFPPMTGSVVDAAQMLDSRTTVRLARLLRAHEQATGARVVVVTLADLQGATIEEFGAQLGDAWGMGLHGKDDSVLLLIDRDKRKVFIEVGAALKARLNDAQTSLIIDMLMTPEFDDSHLAAGVERGAQAVIAALGGQIPDYPEPARQVAGRDEQVDSDQVWLIAVVLTLIVLGIVVISIRRGAAARPARDRATERSGGRFGGGGASGNW